MVPPTYCIESKERFSVTTNFIHLCDSSDLQGSTVNTFQATSFTASSAITSAENSAIFLLWICPNFSNAYCTKISKLMILVHDLPTANALQWVHVTDNDAGIVLHFCYVKFLHCKNACGTKDMLTLASLVCLCCCWSFSWAYVKDKTHSAKNIL